MPDLLDHFSSSSEPVPPEIESIAVHTFSRAMKDYAQGFMVRAEFIGFWNLNDAAEQNQLDALLTQLDAIAQETLRLLKADEYETALIIREAGPKYQTKAEIATRLGL